MKRVQVDFDRVKKNSKFFKKISDDLVVDKYENSKDKFFKEFENHPVTKEIEDGPTAMNSSNTLNGVGNLFSFIGFSNSDSPIQDLIEALHNNFSIKKQNKNGNIRYIIDYPTLEKIKNETPMPWERGNSWVIGIERGISGFSNYLYKRFVQGRSQEALQAENKIRTNSFKKVRYFSKIVNNFINNITK
jgi:hypothetical protein